MAKKECDVIVSFFFKINNESGSKKLFPNNFFLEKRLLHAINFRLFKQLFIHKQYNLQKSVLRSYFLIVVGCEVKVVRYELVTGFNVPKNGRNKG